MEKRWQADDCALMKSHFAVYSIPQASALWCGVPESEVGSILKDAKQISSSGLGRSIWTHPDVPCLEPRCRAIAEALEERKIPYGREDGRAVAEDEQVAHERRRFFGRDLRKWMEEVFPNERPAFLFDDIERSTHTAITADAYRALKADHDKLVSRLENAKSEYKKLREEKEDLERINQSLTAQVGKAKLPGDRAEGTYLNIIGAILDLMLSKSPGGQPYSPFSTQAAVIDVLLANYEGKPGISLRTLEEKFAAAKRGLGAT